MNYPEKSLGALFKNQCQKYPDRPLVFYKAEGQYRPMTWKEMSERVDLISAYLLSLGYKKGERIALLSSNRWEWWAADLAMQTIGLVNVPIHATNSEYAIFYALKHSGARACFVDSVPLASKVSQMRAKCPDLEKVIVFDKGPAGKNETVHLDDALDHGRKFLKNKKCDIQKRLDSIKSGDIATLIYTSGTTGDPKGVQLTHSNFLSNVYQVIEAFKNDISFDDIFFSFLPLSHALERCAGLYVPIAIGASVYFARGISTILEDLADTRPSFFISVPRIYEKIHSGILSKVEEATPLRRAIFNWAVNIGKMNLPYICNNRERRGLFALKFSFAEKLVYSKLKRMLGLDRLKFAISGGGSLAMFHAQFFLGMNIKILEGYGLTETSPVTNVNRSKWLKLGSVGQALEETDIRISDEGEILVKGPQVMTGYYRNARATKEAFTKDGYLHTGDIGIIDRDGFLYVTDRLKDIIVTSGGKNVSPQNIENSLKTSRYIGQIAVVGDREKYLGALIVPDFEELKAWAARHSVSFIDNAELIGKPDVIELFDREIAANSEKFSRVEKIKRFRLLDKEWTIEGGELTPSLKVKRRVINQKFSREIESLFEK